MSNLLDEFRRKILHYAQPISHEDGTPLSAKERFMDAYGNLLLIFRIKFIEEKIAREEVGRAIADFNTAASENKVFSSFQIDENKFFEEAMSEKIKKSSEIE